MDEHPTTPLLEAWGDQMDRIAHLMGDPVHRPDRSRAASKQTIGLYSAVEGWFERFTPAELWDLTHQPYSSAGNEFVHWVEQCYFVYLASVRERLEAEVAESARNIQPHAPQVPEREWGVYVLIGQHGEAFYVGMSGRPRKRLARHRAEFGEHITEIQWTPTQSRREALDLETTMISELRPRMNIAKVTS